MTTLNIQESNFHNITLKEKIDFDITNKLLKSNLVDKKDIAELKKYLGKKTDENDLFSIKYDKKKWGRSYSKGVSLQNLSKIVRHTITNGYYSDLDVKCSSQTIFLQVAKNNNLECEVLERYTTFRDEMLNDVIRTFNVDKDTAKELFIRVSFGGNPKTWLKDIGSKEKLPSYIYEFQSEMKELAEVIEKNNPDIAKWLKKRPSKPQYEKQYTEFTTLSLFYFEHENRILETVYNYLNDNNYIEDDVATLCFDGVMIKKIKEQEKVDKLLNELSIEVFKHHGFNLIFTEKPMTKSLKPQLIKIQEESEDDQEIETNTSNFCIRTINSLKDYDLQKNYWENFFTHLEDSNKDFRLAYKYLNGYWERDLIPIVLESYKRKIKTITINKSGKETSESFVNKWLEDPEAKICYNIVFRPDGNCGENFNLFDGFNYTDILYNRETDTTEIITEEDKQNFNIFIKFIHDYISGNDDKIFNYLIQHLAQIIQKPTLKNDKIFVFFSEGQGRGKSAFLKFFCKVIGQKYGYFDKLDRILSSHTSAHLGRLVNIIEEMDFKESTKYKEILKDFCQRDTAIYNGKCVNEVVVDTFVRYFITTNNTNGINIDDNDRRFVILQILECFDKQLVIQMDRLLKSKKIIYLFGKYLENVELIYESEIEWREARPITDAYKQMVYKSSTEQFIEDVYTCGDFCNDKHVELFIDEDTFKIRTAHLYLLYKDFCKTNTYPPKGRNNFLKEVVNKMSCSKEKSRLKGFSKSQNVLIFKKDGLNENAYKRIVDCDIIDEDE